MIEKVTSSKILHQGKFLNFVEDHVEIEAEPPIKSMRQYVVHPGGVCVVPVLDDKHVVLVKQFRKPVDKVIIEIPAGKIDPGEKDTLLTAKRELKEETGYSAETWLDMGQLLPCPGYSTEILYLYMAKNLIEGDQDLDHGEVVEPLILSFDEAFKQIANGGITDSKTINGIFLAHTTYQAS